MQTRALTREYYSQQLAGGLVHASVDIAANLQVLEQHYPLHSQRLRTSVQE
jgi:hypothetical protein